MKKFHEEQTEAFDSIEQRADYIPEDLLFKETAAGSALFEDVEKSLLNRMLQTIVGPRGCGKTHMMRHAWLKCQKDKQLPFSIYISFNRYYRLEPLLTSRTSPLDEFHAWVLALIVGSMYKTISYGKMHDSIVTDLERDHGFIKEDIEDLISAIEKNQPLSEKEKSLCRNLSIPRIQQIIEDACIRLNRKRVVLFLDDAALVLTPDYLQELLEIIRNLKTSKIAPKASLYPGTTQYSSRFHTGQDSKEVFVWLSLNESSYKTDMDEIAKCRIPGFDKIPSDIVDLIRFASFGIPRAYLTIIQAFKESRQTGQQAKFNGAVQSHINSRVDEFLSLSHKAPKFKNLIKFGESVLEEMANLIKQSNSKCEKELQLLIGIQKDKSFTPIIDRMFKLLIEAGLLYPLGEIKHGTPTRIYDRYIPHSALLLKKRALTSNDRGGALSEIKFALEKPRAKHPIRRTLATLIKETDKLKKIDFCLPPCANCGVIRQNERQKFCMDCGSQLIAVSSYLECLNYKIVKVPGLTEWQISKIATDLPKLETIRDYLAMQDPATELRSVYGFGRKRSSKIAGYLEEFIAEFLS